MGDDPIVTAAHQRFDRRNGVPGPDEAAARARALACVEEVLAPTVRAQDVRGSALGTAWTSEFRVALHDVPGELLRAAGWRSTDRLRARLGLPAGGRWAVSEHGRVLASVHLTPDVDADPVASIVGRALARGEVNLCDVLELRALHAAGARFPDASPVLTVAADIEIGLGSRDLVRWTSGRRADSPAPVARRARRRLVVAASGVDGAGKSSLLDNLATDLERCGVPVSRVWLRPGMGIGPLAALAQRIKRRRGADEAPGIGRISADPDAVLGSRRGVQGWVWSMLVTTAFVLGVRRQHRSASGVVLYDRHVLDALVTLDFAYAGADLRVQRWLVRRLVPRADVALHLVIDVDEAVRRKPGDPIGERAVRRQLEAYAGIAPSLPPSVQLDATSSRDELAAAALDLVLQA
jgi:thymidylate kinase